jgi:hypothetical protein
MLYIALTGIQIQKIVKQMLWSAQLSVNSQMREALKSDYLEKDLIGPKVPVYLGLPIAVFFWF